MQKYHYIRFYILWLLLFACYGSIAQFNLTDKLPKDPQLEIGKLPNGLTYYIQKNTRPEKKAHLRLVVNTGSVLEDADQLGLAHFMEHMNFNGSKNFPKNELVSYLQSIGVEFGADLNAYTGFDETVYILPIPTDDPAKVEKGFTVLEDWAGNALLDMTEIDKERGVVLEESRLGKGAFERMGKHYLPRLFNGSKYAERLPIGKDSILQNFKPEVLKRFYKDWYRPNLMAVIVVGDIEPSVAEQKITSHFSKFKNPAKPRPRPSIIPIAQRTASEAMVLTDKEQPNSILQKFNYVEKSKPVLTWADYRESILQSLFTSMLNQRLTDLTQQSDPPFVFGGSGFGTFLRGYRVFNTFAVLGNKPVNDVIEALVTSEETVKKYGFLQSELDRAKSSLLNQTERAFKDKDKTESPRFVQDYVSNYLNGSPVVGIENRYKFIQQALPGISLTEVNALAQKMESTQGKFVLITAPDKNAGQLPKNQELLAMLDAAHKLPVKAYEEKVVAQSLIGKKPVAGKIISDSSNSTLGTTDLTLSNGITVTLKPTDFKNDEIQMDAWRWGGYHNYGLDNLQNAKYAANVVREMGIKDLSPSDLRKFLAGKTVNALPYLNPLDEGIEGSSSVKDFETFLQLVYLYFTEPRKDEQLFKSYISKQKTLVQDLKVDPFNYFQDTLSKIKYQNNPWMNGIPETRDFDKVNLDKSFGIYQQVFSNAYGMHFTFVGNIDMKTIKPLLETYLGSLPSVQFENKFTDVGARPVKGVVEASVYRGADQKSLVNIIFTGETGYSREEELKLQALAEVVTIKIIEQLREEMSGIYGGGMYGTISKRPYQNYTVSASFPCGPENADKLTKALFDIMKDVKEKGVDQKDLDKVKETWRKQNQEKMKENDHWLSSLSYAWIEKDDPQWILDYEKRVEALTTKDIQETAKKYLNSQNYLKAVLYPEKKQM